MGENIEKKVDKILLRQKTRRNMKRSKRMLKRIPFGMIALLATTVFVLGALFTLYSTYYVDMTGDIDTEGIASGVYWDGVGFTTQNMAISCDCIDITAGETETYTHTIDTDMGMYDITFDVSAMAWLDDPEHEFYGFYFSVWNSTEDITDITLLVTPLETTTVKFNYSLDEMFADVNGNPAPFDLQVIITEHTNINPVAGDDTETGDTCVDIYVLLNDYDPEGYPLDITDVTLIGDWGTSGSDLTIMGIYPNEYLQYARSDSPSGSLTATYTVSDGCGGSDTATVTIL